MNVSDNSDFIPNSWTAHSKIIRISLLTPNLGEGLNSINDLPKMSEIKEIIK